MISNRTLIQTATQSGETSPDLQLVINGEYKKRIDELRILAANTTHDARNPFFRMLQMLEHMRDDPAPNPKKGKLVQH
mgnify:CR=1 FL=1